MRTCIAAILLCFASVCFGSFVTEMPVIFGGSNIPPLFYQWSPNASATAWNLASDWLKNAVPPVTGTALFDSTSYANQPALTTTGTIAALLFGDGVTSTAPITLSGSQLTVTGSVAVQAGAGAVTLALPISGTANVSAQAGITLGGTNNYSGGTSIAGGTLTIGGLSAFSGGITYSPTGTGTVALGDGVSLGNSSSANSWYWPTLALSGSTYLIGPNRLAISGSNLMLGSSNAILYCNTKSQIVISGSITGNSEGTGLSSLEFGGNVGALTVTGGTLDLESSYTGNSYGTLRFNVGETINFPNNGPFTIGSHVLLLSANVYGTGTNSPNITINAGGILDLIDTSVTVNSLAGGGAVYGSLSSTNTAATTLTLAGGTTSAIPTFSGSIASGLAQVLTLNMAGPGTQALTGSNSYTGGTTLSGGTLILGNPYALSSGTITRSIVAGNPYFAASTNLTGTAAMPVQYYIRYSPQYVTGSNSFEFSKGILMHANETLTNTMTSGTFIADMVYLSDTSSTGYTLTIGGSGNTLISGSVTNCITGAGAAGGFTVNNTGTTTLSGSSNYNGATTITNGMLIAANANALGTGACTVANNTGAVLALNSGTLSMGALTFSGANAAVRFTGTTTGIGMIASTGAVALGGCKVNILGTLASGTYTLMTSSTMTGTVVTGSTPFTHSTNLAIVGGTMLRLTGS